MRYRSVIADSARWDGFPFRPGDIVISTPPKCGTTWTQMLCALLIFDGPDFPAPMDQMSPWMDMCNRSIADVWNALAAQTHRRFIKTHTPLDGVPLRDDVTYLVVSRDPRDVAISYEHHAANMDDEHFMKLRAAAMGNDDLAELPPRSSTTPISRPISRANCCAWRTFSAFPVRRSVREPSCRKRASPACATAPPNWCQRHRWGTGRTRGASSAAAERANGARGSPTPISPPTRHGWPRWRRRTSRRGPTVDGSRPASIRIGKGVGVRRGVRPAASHRAP